MALAWTMALTLLALFTTLVFGLLTENNKVAQPYSEWADDTVELPTRAEPHYTGQNHDIIKKTHTPKCAERMMYAANAESHAVYT